MFLEIWFVNFHLALALGADVFSRVFKRKGDGEARGAAAKRKMRRGRQRALESSTSGRPIDAITTENG